MMIKKNEAASNGLPFAILSPAMFRIDNAFAITANRFPDAGNRIVRKIVERKPAQVIALLQFHIFYVPFPALSLKKEIETFFVSKPMHDHF
jgi:hypothetical protein